MKPETFARFFPILLLCLWLFGAISGSGAPGAADPLFAHQIGVNAGDIEAIAVQPDGKIIVGGRINSVGGVPCKGLVRLFPDGYPDTNFNFANSLKSTGIEVSGIRLQKDGKILAYGWFPAGEGAGPEVMRFHQDGNVDTSFAITPGGSASVMELLPDGKVLVGGTFFIGNETTPRYLLRLNQDGSLDQSFTLTFNDYVNALQVLDDGRIMVGGSFTDVEGTTQGYLVRLNANGSLDATYNANLTSSVYQLLAQPDGRLILAQGTTTGSTILRRLLPEGLPDATFTTTLSDPLVANVTCLQLQTDGKILLGGRFDTVNGTARIGLARLFANGALDSTFVNSGTDNFGNGAIVLQLDGKILVSGNFSSLGGVNTPILARLQNDPAGSSFVKDTTTLKWLRSGSSSELGHVSFEVHDHASNEWQPLGNASRIIDGWSVPSGSLTSNGTVRARGIGRTGPGGTSEIREFFSFGSAIPSMVVNGPAGTEISNGSTVDAGNVLDAYTIVKHFSVENTGPGVLDGLSLAISGPDATQFSVVEFSPGQVGPQSELPFGIRFSPVGTGVRSAVLTIASNNPGGTFTVNLTGTGTSVFSPFFSSATAVPLVTSTFSAAGKTFGTLGLGFAPAPGTVLTAIDQTGNNPISGHFPDQPDGSRVTATFGGQTYVFVVGYQGGVPYNTAGNNLTLTLTGAGVPQREFMPQITDYNSGIAVSPNGTMIVYDRSGYLVMLKPDGSRVTTFPPTFSLNGSSGFISHAATCPDGKFIVAGYFNQVNGISRPSLTRFDTYGNLDPAFTTTLAGTRVYALAVQGDGKILISGGGVDETDVFRLNADGNSDPGFSLNADGLIDRFQPLANGKIMVGGSFTVIDGVPRSRLARLNPDGSLDTSFTFTAGNSLGGISSMAEQSDGKLLIADGAGISTARLWRLNPDGSFDSTFLPDLGASTSFDGLAFQADGKILVGGGRFADLNGRYRSGIARLFPDGTSDPTFGGICFEAMFLAPLGDGEMIINGGIVAGTVHTGLARLTNDPAVMDLEVPDTATVRLVTGGAAPLSRSVAFDLLASGATEWVRLAAPDRIAGGWSLSGQTLPAGGIIRWRAIPACSNSASVVIEGYKNFGTTGPNIVVAGPAGNVLTNGSGGVDFGPVLTGENRNLKVRVTNLGDGGWGDFTTAISGTHAGSLTVVSMPERAVLPGETGVFEFRFAPVASGSHSALLVISSNDPAHSPFQIPLTGTAGDVLSPMFYDAADVVVTKDSFTAAGKQFGTLQLAFAPPAGTVLTAVTNTGSVAISGRFGDLADGAVVSAEFGGSSYQFIAGYAGGDGNDLVLSLIGPGILDLTHQAITSSGSVVSTPMEDGGTLIGGGFGSINGQIRSRFARLEADGGVAPDFNPNIASSTSSSNVSAIHRLPNGKTIIAGEFTTLDGEPVTRIVRLMPDGSIDPLFLVAPDLAVRTAAVQADGKIVIGGDFLKVNGVTRNRIARLNEDGSLDAGFNPNASASVRYSTVQSDGKIIIAGLFTSVGGTSRPYLARLESNGALDLSFTPTLAGSQGTVTVNAIQVQPDGKIVIGGNFDRLNGVTCNLIGRLTSAGATDPTFNANVSALSSRYVMAIAPQVDGKLLIGGNFTSVNGVVRNRFARLNPDGSLDETINPDFKGTSVNHIALRPDGKIQVSGLFTSVNGVARQGFVRLLNHNVISSFEKSGSSVVRWLRGATYPLETKVTFDMHGPGGTAWQVLGEAVAIPGGWELGGLSLPPSAVMRTRSQVAVNNASYQQSVLLPAFGNVVPTLAVRDSAGNLLQDQVSEWDFGSVPTSLAVDMELQIANEGLATLDNIVVTLAGISVGDFSLIEPPPTSLPPTELASIRVRFTPTAAGFREAELRISSTDPGASPFVVKLTGAGGSVFSPVFSSVNDKSLSGADLNFSGQTFGSLILKFLPPVGKALMAAENTGTGPFGVMLAGLPDQSRVTAEFGGETYQFLATYRGGDGNDLAFVRLGPGVADPEFDPRLGSFAGTFGLQPDGRVIVAGNFTTLGGLPSSRIMRLLPDGSVDPSFNVSLSHRADGMAVLRNGKTIVTSSVVTPQGIVGGGLSRLNADGSLDLAFAPQITGSVLRVTELRNGKILIGGNFTKVGTVTKSCIALLNADGTLDTGFTTTVAGPTVLAVYAFVEQADGKLLIGGTFTSVNGTARNQLARLSSTGVLDTTFNTVLAGPTTLQASTGVTSMMLQPDGRILVGGYFTSVAGVPRNRLVRLNPDGSLDPGFLANVGDAPITMLVQVDGKILITGSFSQVNGAKRAGIARLNGNGSLDVLFDPRPLAGTPSVFSMVMQADGTLLIGGIFSSMNGIGSGMIARLLAETVSSNLETVDGSSVVWSRSGALAELQETSFEVSDNGGTTWTSLGAGTRTATGWTLSGLNLPAQGHLRAKGYEILSNRSSGLATEIGLYGRTSTAIELWRKQQFGTALSDGWAADSGDVDQDGLKNLMEFALGLNPKMDSSGSLPGWMSASGGYEIGFPKPAGVEGITYGAEWSETLGANDWHPAENISVGGWQSFRAPSAESPNLFFRLKVTNP